MKRFSDILLASTSLLLLLVPMVLIAVAIKLTSPGPILYWSGRVGRNNRIFQMPKFRTMRIDTPEVATHLLEDSRYWMTPIGHLLRKTSLDELPQLWSILIGHMSFVGPRPALHNQNDLVALRTERDVHRIPPGLTGWAQINGRDELTIPDKVRLDAYYMENSSLPFDLKILFLTGFRAIRGDGVAQRGD